MVQLARLLMGRDEVGEAADLLMSARDECVALHLYDSALEASVYLSDCRRRLGDPASALELLAEAETEAGEEAEMLAPQVSRVRALALLDLGSGDAALATLAVGVQTARDQKLGYELTLLLEARARVLGALGRQLDADEIRQIGEISGSLGLSTGDGSM